jgi:hypothetical protein
MPYLIEVTDGAGRPLIKENAATEEAAHVAICDATARIRHFLIRKVIKAHETDIWSPLTVRFEHIDI